VIAEVKRWWTEDAEPTPPFLVQAEVGPSDAPGGDTFSFEVVTPDSLADRVTERPLWLRGVLLVERGDAASVDAALRQLVSSTSGADWPEVAARLGRFLHWEFEGYRDHS
jgi:hypothetical protein